MGKVSLQTLQRNTTTTALQRELRSLSGCFPLRLAVAQVLVSCLPEFALVSVRAALYRWAGIKIARGVTVQGRLYLVGRRKDLSQIQIGEGCILAPGVRIGLDAPVVIGKNVALGPDVVLCTATHTMGFGSRRMIPALDARPVTLGEGSWICMRALVLPGVTIGPGAVVAAGSIVTEDIPAHTLVAGNPAQVQHELPFANR